MGVLLDCTVAAVQDTEAGEPGAAMATRLESRKASWKLYRHFFLAPLLFCSLASIMEEVEQEEDEEDEEHEGGGRGGAANERLSRWAPMYVGWGRGTSGRGGPSMSPCGAGRQINRFSLNRDST